MTDDSLSPTTLSKLAADIVVAFVGANTVESSELPELIQRVYTTLCRVSAPQAAFVAPARKPAVPIKKSVGPDYLVCLEDGKRFRSLKRHLRTCYGLSTDEYRARWGLGPDYPMVAPGYARERSRLAKQMGLGLQRRKTT